MKLKEIVFGWLLMLLNIAAGLMMVGIMSHLAWYFIEFGWSLLP